MTEQPSPAVLPYPSRGEPPFVTPLLRDRAFTVEYADTLARMGLVDDLVRAREAQGLTQTAVARRMGVSQPTISGFENEASDPRLSTVQRYARAIGKRVIVTLAADSEAGHAPLAQSAADRAAPHRNR